MKTFVLVEYQGGGCDYTIGCGFRVSRFEAESKEEAMKFLMEALRERKEEGEELTVDQLMDEQYGNGENYLDLDIGGGEHSPEQIVLIEASDITDLGESIAIIQSHIDDKEQAEAEKSKEDSERKQYEELKKKFG